MDCPRCKGLMVIEPYIGLWDPVRQSPCVAWRCVLCGEMLDPVIVSNRATPRSAHEDIFEDETALF